MKKIFSLLIASLLTASALQAEQIFVLFDGSCGDRVHYDQATAKQSRSDYYAYQFGFTGGDRLILETGTEGSTVQNYLPQDYIYCDDPRLTLDLAKQVNAGVDQIFMLLPDNDNQYIIQPVVMASTLQRRGAVFVYQSPLAAFSFDIDNGIIGENLAIGDQEATKVYFEGRETNPCSGYFLFRQLKPGASYPVIDYKISPEIGIYERRLGSDGISTTGGTIVARDVNNRRVSDYMASICTSSAPVTSASNVPSSSAVNQYGQQVPATPQSYGGQSLGSSTPSTDGLSHYSSTSSSQLESQAYGQTTTGTSPIFTTYQAHTVVKGETLYGLSRKYGTTVDEIKRENKMTNNTVFPGQQLMIKKAQSAPPATTTRTTSVARPQTNRNTTVMNPTVPTLPYNSGSVATSNQKAVQPTAYGSTTTATATPQAYSPAATSSELQVYSEEQAVRGQTAVYGENLHIVQPGETVASIALKYGFTTAKFREMNGLGAKEEVVKVGAKLKRSDCNCSAATTVAAAAPAPATYEKSPSTLQPYDPQAPANQPQVYGGSAVVQPASAYRTPEGYQSSTNADAPTTTTVRRPEQAMITNNPNFGQVVPNTAAPASTSMGRLEGRGQTVTTPTAYGSYNAPAAAPTSYGAYTSPAAAPATYNAPQPVSNAYSGSRRVSQVTAVTRPAANRSFHLVQEGESLYAISRRYGLTTDQLRRLNNLEVGSVIVPFQKLYVN